MVVEFLPPVLQGLDAGVAVADLERDRLCVELRLGFGELEEFLQLYCKLLQMGIHLRPYLI